MAITAMAMACFLIKYSFFKKKCILNFSECEPNDSYKNSHGTKKIHVKLGLRESHHSMGDCYKQ